MKCPNCKESLGLFAKNAKEAGDKDNQINICPHCNNPFKFEYSKLLAAILAFPLIFLSFLMFSSSLMHIIGVGISFALAVAIVIKAEPIKEETQS
mgnify:CR=1 FL=1